MSDNLDRKINLWLDDLRKEDVMQRVIMAVRKELGNELPSTVIATAMIMAAGYSEVTSLGGIMGGSIEANKHRFIDGARLAPCQCMKCSNARIVAKESADAVLRKAAGHG